MGATTRREFLRNAVMIGLGLFGGLSIDIGLKAANDGKHFEANSVGEYDALRQELIDHALYTEGCGVYHPPGNYSGIFEHYSEFLPLASRNYQYSNLYKKYYDEAQGKGFMFFESPDLLLEEDALLFVPKKDDATLVIGAIGPGPGPEIVGYYNVIKEHESRTGGDGILIPVDCDTECIHYLCAAIGSFDKMFGDDLGKHAILINNRDTSYDIGLKPDRFDIIGCHALHTGITEEMPDSDPYDNGSIGGDDYRREFLGNMVDALKRGGRWIIVDSNTGHKYGNNPEDVASHKNMAYAKGNIRNLFGNKLALVHENPNARNGERFILVYEKSK